MTDFAALTAELAAYNATHAAKMAQADAAKENANRAADAADSGFVSGKTNHFIYVHETQGDDASPTHQNDETPVATLEEALRRTIALRPNRIRLLTNINFTGDVSLNVALPYISIEGWDAGTNVAAQRKVTVKDDASGALKSAQWRIRHSNQIASFLKVDVELDSQYDTPFIELDEAEVVARLRECTPSQTAGNAASLFSRRFNYGSRLHFAVSLFAKDNVDGKIIKGIPDGTAFDDISWVSSNLDTL